MSQSRAKAPKVKVKTGHRDIRTEIINELNEKHPEFVHSFQDINKMSADMLFLDMEWVKNNTYDKDGDNEVKMWRRDGIARVPRDISEARSNAAGEESAATVEALYCRESNNEDWKKNTVGRRVRTPKDPTKIGNNGGM